MNDQFSKVQLWGGRGNVAQVRGCRAFDLRDVAQQLAHLSEPHRSRGFTFCPVRGTCVNCSSFEPRHFIVSIQGFERKFPCYPTQDELFPWIRDAEVSLRAAGAYVGGWWHSGKFYLDVSIVVEGLCQAIAVANANAQQFIFHPETGDQLELPAAKKGQSKALNKGEKSLFQTFYMYGTGRSL
jgi:hypothetical protein